MSLQSIPVAVVIPFHEADRYLDRLGGSLADQGAREVIVVVDDGEPVARVEAALRGVPGLRVLRTAGKLGAGKARNVGVRAATQPWIAFLDADDWWEPGFLRELFAAAGSDIVAYDSRLWRDDGESVVGLDETLFGQAEWTRPSIGRAESELLLTGFPILKLMLKKETFDAIGGYREFPAVQDFDLVWRLIAADGRIETISSPCGNYLVRSGSITDQVRTNLDAYERGQRCWVRIWSDMARDGRLPGRVRAICARRSAAVAARIPARRLKNVVSAQLK